MSGSTIMVRSPSGKASVRRAQLNPRPESLKGLTVGIEDNGWVSFGKLAERFTTMLKERCEVADVRIYEKEADVKFGRGTRPGAPEFLKRIAEEVDVAIVGLGN